MMFIPRLGSWPISLKMPMTRYPSYMSRQISEFSRIWPYPTILDLQQWMDSPTVVISLLGWIHGTHDSYILGVLMNLQSQRLDHHKT